MTPAHRITGTDEAYCVQHGKRVKAGERCPLCALPPRVGPPESKAGAKYRATPTHVDGIRFASKTEAALYEYAKSTSHVVVPHVRFPLHCLTSPGMPATWFTPDLVVIGIGLYQGSLEAWEAKGAKACESRDYQLRARAFRLSYPRIPLRVFRKVRGEFVEDRLEMPHA